MVTRSKSKSLAAGSRSGEHPGKKISLGTLELQRRTAKRDAEEEIEQLRRRVRALVAAGSLSKAANELLSAGLCLTCRPSWKLFIPRRASRPQYRSWIRRKSTPKRSSER